MTLANDEPPLSKLDWDTPYPDEASSRTEVICHVHQLRYDDRIGNFAVLGVGECVVSDLGNEPCDVTLGFYGKFRVSDPEWEMKNPGLKQAQPSIREVIVQLDPMATVRVARETRVTFTEGGHYMTDGGRAYRLSKPFDLTTAVEVAVD